MGRILKIEATEPQEEFHALEVPFRGFIAGFGAGKTEAICQATVIDIHHGGGLNIAIYSPTYKMLRAVLLPRVKEALEANEIEYSSTMLPMEIVTKNPRLGNISFHSLENPNSIRSYEFYRIHVDEFDTLGVAKCEEAWNLLIGRCRQTLDVYNVDNPFNQVSVYTTPEGFGFTHQRWKAADHKDYAWVHASSYSNPYLPASYIENIKATYPEALADAYIYGEFVNLTSGTVYRSYDRTSHNSTERVKENECIFVGMDFNIDNMAATVYVKRNCESNDVAAKTVTWHAVDEISDAHNTPVVAEMLRQRYPNNKIVIYPDSSGKNRTSSGGVAESDIAVLRGEPYKFECRFRPSNPRIRDRVNAMNAALEKGRVRINSATCPRTVECLEQQAYDKRGAPDKTSGKDHQNDATTYPIAYEFPLKKPVANVAISFKI